MPVQSILLASVFVWLVTAYAVAAGEEPVAKVDIETASQFFETKVRPLLVERCFDCHSDELPESGLRLDSLQGMIDGGERGPAIKPGDAKNSLLVHAVNHSEADLQMPEGEKLSAVEIKYLARWIDEGAVWPGEKVTMRGPKAIGVPLFTEADESFWAFVPPELPGPPDVRDEAWIQSDIDRFILSRLERHGLKPAPPASKRSLLRRVYFDLIGLPPTPKQLRAFLADRSPVAFERVIDQLLSSPQYGERWGRHWLDVARYADSNGLDENWAFEFIYKYRDWVINAFNNDLPYDAFIKHQLAGDLIPQQADETQMDYIHRVAAAGFLSVGPKMIADDDPKKKKMDIIDEQLSTVSQTFMALTVGCARCHDHKFDPIPTWDYYALAGIFKSTKTMEHLRVVAPVWLHEFKTDDYQQELAAYEVRRNELIRRRDVFWKRVTHFEDRASNKEKPFELPKAAGKLVPEAYRDQWKELSDAVRAHEKSKPEPIKVMAPTEGELEDLRVSLRGNYLTLGQQTRRQFLRIIEGEQPKPIETTQSGRLDLAEWIARPDHPLTARVLVNRFWRWRFGRGIVSTVDNFGRLGERPTHPKLLDWLAIKFVEDGWSMKRLHKRMLLSSTYQMSTQFDEQKHGVDPRNAFWWRFPRRRLEAEVIRDSLLAASDYLDLTMQGSLMPLKDREYVTGTASKTQKYDNPRRSVYQPVYRSAVYDLLSVFDFPDPATPSGDRHDSVVAPQALLMMNSPLVNECAQRMAEQTLKEGATTEARIDALFEKTVSRKPSNRERSAILFHLSETRKLLEASSGGAEPSKAELAAWQGICRTLLSSNEFLYLE